MLARRPASDVHRGEHQRHVQRRRPPNGGSDRELIASCTPHDTPSSRSLNTWRYEVAIYADQLCTVLNIARQICTLPRKIVCALARIALPGDHERVFSQWRQPGAARLTRTRCGGHGGPGRARAGHGGWRVEGGGCRGFNAEPSAPSTLDPPSSAVGRSVGNVDERRERIGAGWAAGERQETAPSTVAAHRPMLPGRRALDAAAATIIFDLSCRRPAVVLSKPFVALARERRTTDNGG